MYVCCSTCWADKLQRFLAQRHQLISFTQHKALTATSRYCRRQRPSHYRASLTVHRFTIYTSTCTINCLFIDILEVIVLLLLGEVIQNQPCHLQFWAYYSYCRLGTINFICIVLYCILKTYRPFQSGHLIHNCQIIVQCAFFAIYK